MSGTLQSKEPRSFSTRFRQHPLLSLREEMDELMTRCFGGKNGLFDGCTVPSIDLSETNTAVDVKMDLPGVNPEEVDITVSGNVLTVSGERKEEREEHGKTYHRMERDTGSFSRSMTLPCATNEDEVVAEYQEGVLTITLPKSEEAKSRQIKIKY